MALCLQSVEPSFPSLFLEARRLGFLSNTETRNSGRAVVHSVSRSEGLVT